ncbi:hypothetical protein JYU34_019701 [Plutella xylostella]|uniref:Uncharacterized protein n=1 Tax=Plutella xylostella TaxID=51655 RepID=A0ABQ7PV39_PLUXY|nr:hypothetical protein JYU34_019701 [Plutella xylostella]
MTRPLPGHGAPRLHDNDIMSQRRTPVKAISENSPNEQTSLKQSPTTQDSPQGHRKKQ